MNRNHELLATISKEQLGIEVAPWFAPLTPRRAGYNCLTLDVMSRADLVARASADPNVDPAKLAEVEDVDLVGSAGDIQDLVGAKGLAGQVDYVVSSHNFEHLPNPVRFLQGCEAILRPGGQLIMAVPDLRGCFDHFRPPTALSEWLEAHFEQRRRPLPRQTFDQGAYTCRRVANAEESMAFSVSDNPSELQPYDRLAAAYQSWRAAVENPDDVYRDTHCSTFTPASLQLLLTELSILGLISLELTAVSATNVFEFYLRLRKPLAVRSGPASDLHARRTHLLRQSRDELAEASVWGWQQKHRVVTPQPSASPWPIAKLVEWIKAGRS
jgi:SAM-dependent methyltransferase